MKTRGIQIAQSLAKSVIVGVGQFCTKPGLFIGLRDANLTTFAKNLADAISATPCGTMLHSGISERYRAGIARRQSDRALQLATPEPSNLAATQVSAAVFATDAKSFLGNSALAEELFGPATLVISCESHEDLEEVARSLEGQLTVTIQATERDVEQHGPLLDILREKAGRLVFGGVPTGVEVAPAMHHGGPYPATTDPRFTSVGTAAILRFVRPVCYQDFPQEWLPPELKDENPRGIWRLTDGKWTRAAIGVRSAVSA